MLWDTGREEALARGNLVHQLMGWVRSADDLDDALDRLHRTGAAQTDELPILRGTAERIIAHPSLQQFFQKGLTNRNECDIITQNGIILRPDRLVFKGEKVSILDYKTGSKSPIYRRQLEAYADTLGAMGYTIENKVIVYIDDHIQPEFI
jgi:ATP-dependent exoDNAse (exonuclease V) beta subunit